ncbi:MAG: PAS domain-containing sensor histidine kinase [Proteobacteria bacterium]|nr:PAS domain-containing sensor histidine kinase [Pseudomonadota bacterium]
MWSKSSIDALLTPIVWIDGNGILLGGNAALARWLGVSLRRLEGLPLAALDGEDGRLKSLLARLAPAVEAAQVRRARLQAPGGGERFADLLLARDADGIRIEIHPADEFPGTDPASALPAALHAALKGLAHEIRNPLAGLKGAAQLLARRASMRLDNDDERELVALIDAEVERLAGLLDRLVNPAPSRPFETVNIHAVLERVRVLADADAGWAVKIERDYDPSLPAVSGDADRLVQALWNLLRNALESGANMIHLRTRAERGVVIGEVAHRLALRVEIADDGRGVPEDLAERIFLPLVSGRAEGSGLGLALAQQVAREHGGSLGYRSRPGHTVFTLLIPVRDDAAGGGE